MAEKNLKARIVHKHDTEANWLLATNFTPKQGEIIVYDIDDTHSYERFKIGDGVQNVNDLPFADDTLRAELAAQITEVDEKVSEVSALVGDTAVSEQIDAAIAEIPQADWNQNDETASDYIKNRPFYEKNGYVAKWVGEEAEFVIDHWHKVSDTVVYLDEIVGKTCECPKQGVSINLTSDVLVQKNGYVTWYVDYYQDFVAGLFVAEEITYVGHTFTPGIYIYSNLSDLLTGEWYIGRDYFIKTLDPKYIKDMYYTEDTFTAHILEYPDAPDSSSGTTKTDIEFANLLFNNRDMLKISVNGVDISDTLTGVTESDVSLTWRYNTDITTGGSFVCVLSIDPDGLPTGDVRVGDELNQGWSNATLQIDIPNEVVHHLDSKYIKDMYHEESVEVFSVENATFVDKGYMLETPFAIEDGNTYIVSWDGVEYTCEAYTFEGISVIGNTAEFGGKGNGEPFNIGYASFDNVTFVNSLDDLATHTFSVTEIIRHTIAPKYIKDMYYDNTKIVEVNETCYVGGMPCPGNVTLGNLLKSGHDLSNIVITINGSICTLEFEETYYKVTGIPESVESSGSCCFNFNSDGGVYLLNSAPDGNVTTTATFTGYYEVPDLKQIDTKYLPILEDAYETIIETEVIDYIALVGPEYGKLLGKYVVVIDGVSETVEFIDDGIGSFVETDSFYIGSWTDPEGNVDNNGFEVGLVNPDGNPHSVEIIAIKDIIKEEYLPESVTAKPDWEQGNPNGAGYIENRTHYEEKNVIIDTKVDVTTEAKVKGYTTRAYYRFNKLLDYKDARVRVVYDGIEYDCEVKRSGDSINGEVDGHGCHIGDENLIEYPFYVFFHYEWNVVGTTTPGTHRFEISDVKIHHLNPKYIKDMYYEVNGLTTVVPETEVQNRYTITLSNASALTVGQKCIITIDGTKYEATVRENVNLTINSGVNTYPIGIGSWMSADTTTQRVGIVQSVDDCPFALLLSNNDLVFFYETDNATNDMHTVEVCIKNCEIHQLDEKFIPDTIARVNNIPQPDWNQHDPTAPDYVKNRPFYEAEVKNTFGEGVANGFTGDYSGGTLCLYETDCVLPMSEYIVGEEYVVNINGEEHLMKLDYQWDMSTGSDYVGFNIDTSMSGSTFYRPYFTSDYDFGLSYRGYFSQPDDGDIVELQLSLYLPQGAILPVTVQVYQSDYELKQLDPKYIKDMYYDTSIEEVVIEEDVEITAGMSSCEGSFSANINIVPNDTYTLYVNGTLYGTATTADGHLMFGSGYNLWQINDGGRVYTFYDGGVYTLKLVHNITEFKQLDEKYIPDSIARVEDVEAVSTLVGDTSVAEQINTVITNSVADWSQTDESAPDYIKNRTHYDNLTTIFNMDTYNDDDYASLEDNAFMYNGNPFYKVSDIDGINLSDSFSFDILVNSNTNEKYFVNDVATNTSESAVVIDFQNYPGTPITIKRFDLSYGAYIGLYGALGMQVVKNHLFVSLEDDSEFSTPDYDVVLPKGIWVDRFGGQCCFNSLTASEVKKLDEKYIPTATDDEIIEMLTELDMIPVVTDYNGAILADESNNILLW